MYSSEEMGSEEQVSVEQAAAERRERLRALKAARELSETAADDDKSVQAQGDVEPQDAERDTEEK